MVSKDAIFQAVKILVEAANPITVILFGSYARRDARDDSDVDLLVVERGISNTLAEMVRLRNLVRPLRIPVDIIVVSEDDRHVERNHDFDEHLTTGQPPRFAMRQLLQHGERQRR